MKIFLPPEMLKVSDDGIFFVYNGTELWEQSLIFMTATQLIARYKMKSWKHNYLQERILALVWTMEQGRWHSWIFGIMK